VSLCPVEALSIVDVDLFVVLEPNTESGKYFKFAVVALLVCAHPVLEFREKHMSGLSS
jgi:hypothetical protein